MTVICVFCTVIFAILSAVLQTLRCKVTTFPPITDNLPYQIRWRRSFLPHFGIKTSLTTFFPTFLIHFVPKIPCLATHKHRYDWQSVILSIVDLMIKNCLLWHPKRQIANCTFLYRSILKVLYFCLCFSYLQNLKTLPHEFNTKLHIRTQGYIREGRKLVEKNITIWLPVS